MILHFKKEEKDSIAQACAVGSVQCEFFEIKGSDLMMCMITNDGAEPTALMAWRISALASSYDETRRWNMARGIW